MLATVSAVDPTGVSLFLPRQQVQLVNDAENFLFNWSLIVQAGLAQLIIFDEVYVLYKKSLTTII